MPCSPGIEELPLDKIEEWLARPIDVLPLVKHRGGGFHFSGTLIKVVTSSPRPCTIPAAAWKDFTDKQKREAYAQLELQAVLISKALAKLNERAQQLRGLMDIQTFKGA